MKQTGKESDEARIAFQKLMEKIYERGTSEKNITVGKLVDDIIGDLKIIVTKHR